MSSDLDKLMLLLPPPRAEVVGPPWHRSRLDIGFEFPEDYRQFVDRYGAGIITSDNEMLPFTIDAPCSVPTGGGPSSGFNALAEKQLSQVRPLFVFDGADEDYWGGPVYPIYPDPGGLWAWGENHEGDMFFWLTQDSDPNAWPVVMWARGPATTYVFEGGMVSSLLSLLSGQHPVVDWIAKPQLRWTMHTDWEHSGLSSSAGFGTTTR